MKRFGFLKKEINEVLRTYKLFVIPAVLVFLGILSPLTARYMKELFEAIGTGMEGMTITMKDPVYTDAYLQFFGNVGQMGLIVVILIFMGMVVEEKVKGSGILVLSKPVSRANFILSKFFTAAVLFTASYVLAVLACMFYTFVLFPKFYNDYLVLSLAVLWLYGIFIIAITIFGSTIAKSHAMAAVYSFAGYIGASVIGSIPRLDRVTPGALSTQGLKVLLGAEKAGAVVVPSIITVICIVLFIWGSVEVLKRQEL